MTRAQKLFPRLRVFNIIFSSRRSGCVAAVSWETGYNNRFTLSTKKAIKISLTPADWISPAKAARIRKVSRQAIGKLIKARRIETIEIGGRKLLKLADVLGFQPRKPGRRKRKQELDAQR